MSRSKQSQLSSSDSESDDDFYAKKPTESRSSSRLERPQSAISNTTDSKKSKSKKSVSSSDEDEPAKPLKSGSSTSIASKLKNAVKNTFRSSSSSSKKSSKKSDNKKQIKKCDTEEESSRSHSIERSIKNVLKSQNRIEKNEFSRPHTRFDNNSSASTTDRSLDTDRTEKNASVLKTSSDDDTVLPSSDKKTLKKIDSTNFKKEARSDSSDSSSSNSSSDNSTRSKGLKKKSSISKNSDNSGSDSDTEQETSIPIRVKFEKKPPIDKSKWKLEKPESGSEQSDTERSSTRIHQKARFLGKTFDLNSDSQSSGNEMTDVSPLQTPKNVSSNKLDMRVFYKALDQQNDNEFETYTSKSAKRNSSVKQNSGLNHNYDNDYAYTSHTNNSLDLDNFDYKMSPVSEKLMRNGPLENKRYYDKLVKQGNFKSPYTKVHKPFRVTSSALNRQREQQRIEKENQVILKRLLHVKASKHVVKEEQLKDYEKNFGLSTLNYSKMEPLGADRSFTPSTSSMGMSSKNTSRLSTKRSNYRTSANNSRCSSAKSNVHTDNHFNSFSHTSFDPNDMLRRATSSSRSRPQWNDKW